MTYPLALCPWHIAPTAFCGVGAATAVALLITGGYVMKLSALYREARHDAQVRAGQAAWRELKYRYAQRRLERTAAERVRQTRGRSAATGGSCS